MLCKILFSIVTLFFSQGGMAGGMPSMNLGDSLTDSLFFTHNLRQDMKNSTSLLRESSTFDIEYNHAWKYILDVLEHDFSDISQEQQRSLLPVWHRMIEDALKDADTQLLEVLASSIVKGWGGDSEHKKDMLSYDDVKGFSWRYYFCLPTLSDKHLTGLVFWYVYTYKNPSIHRQIMMCENFSKLEYQKLAKNLFMQTFTNSNFMQTLINVKETFRVSGDIEVLYEKFDMVKTSVKMIGIDGFEKDIYDISHDENIPASDKLDLIGACKANMDKDAIIDMCVHVCRSNRANRGDYAFSKYQGCLKQAIEMIRTYGDNYEESVDLARNFYNRYKNQNMPSNYRHARGLFVANPDFT